VTASKANQAPDVVSVTSPRRPTTDTCGRWTTCGRPSGILRQAWTADAIKTASWQGKFYGLPSWGGIYGEIYNRTWRSRRGWTCPSLLPCSSVVASVWSPYAFQTRSRRRVYQPPCASTICEAGTCRSEPHHMVRSYSALVAFLVKTPEHSAAVGAGLAGGRPISTHPGCFLDLYC